MCRYQHKENELFKLDSLDEKSDMENNLHMGMGGVVHCTTHCTAANHQGALDLWSHHSCHDVHLHMQPLHLKHLRIQIHKSILIKDWFLNYTSKHKCSIGVSKHFHL